MHTPPSQPNITREIVEITLHQEEDFMGVEMYSWHAKQNHHHCTHKMKL
jgi:hypothetical protein